MQARKMTRASRALQLAAAVGLLGYGSTAMALFDVQVLVGKRWYDMESANANGTTTTHGRASQEVQAAAHLSPIPLIPVGFGVGVKLGDIATDDQPGISESKVFEAGLDITAWLPFVPVVTPYARLNYPLVATVATKGKTNIGNGEQEFVSTSKLSGFHLNAGIKYAPLPLVGFLLEAGLSQQKAKLDENKVGGVKQSLAGVKETEAHSKTFLIGVEIGL